MNQNDVGENRKYFLCECSAEGIAVEVDKENDEVVFAFFQFGRGGTLSLKQKCRYIWNVVKTGMPFDDMVIMDFDETRKLNDFLYSKVN